MRGRLASSILGAILVLQCTFTHAKCVFDVFNGFCIEVDGFHVCFFTILCVWGISKGCLRLGSNSLLCWLRTWIAFLAQSRNYHMSVIVSVKFCCKAFTCLQILRFRLLIHCKPSAFCSQHALMDKACFFRISCLLWPSWQGSKRPRRADNH